MQEDQNSRKIIYNSYMIKQIKYHLLKNTYKGKIRYNIAFPNSSGKGYASIELLRDEKGRTVNNRDKARILAERYIQDLKDEADKEAREARIKAKHIAEGGEELEPFLTAFWSMDSDYVKGKTAEDRNITEIYVAQSLNVLKKYFFPWARKAGITRIGKLSQIDLLRWRNDLVQEVKEKNLGISVVNRTRLALHVPLNWLFVMRQIPYNPLIAVGKIKEPVHERQPFERAELEKIFALEWKRNSCKLACMLSAYTGMRISEIQGLEWANLNLDDGYLNVIQQYQEAKKRGICSPKYGSVRHDVPIPDELAIELQRMRFASDTPLSPFVFPCSNGKKPISRATLTYALTQACKKVKIPVRSFHSLRHSYAVMLREKIGIEGVRLSLGHSTVKTTQRYSDHLSEDDRLRNKNVVNGFMRHSL